MSCEHHHFSEINTSKMLRVVLGKQLLWSEWFKNLPKLVLNSSLEPYQCQKTDSLGLLFKFVGGRE